MLWRLSRISLRGGNFTFLSLSSTFDLHRLYSVITVHATIITFRPPDVLLVISGGRTSSLSLSSERRKRSKRRRKRRKLGSSICVAYKRLNSPFFRFHTVFNSILE